MTIPSHLKTLNDMLTDIERTAEEAPAGAYMQVKLIAEVVDEASNALRKALKGRGMVALNDDRLREVEAVMLGYIMKGNPTYSGEVATAQGYAQAMNTPAADRVREALVRDTAFLESRRTEPSEPAENEPSTPRM